MSAKRVETIDDIVFENANPVITLAKGSRYTIEDVHVNGIILCAEDGERYMIDLQTFENGFIAVEDSPA